MSFETKHVIKNRPRSRRSGELSFFVSRSWAEKNHESALTVVFISDRKLFGLAYWGVQPEYFDSMPRDSGVFVCPNVPIKEIIPGAKKPGDIDILLIPYENDEIILNRIMAIEVKSVRATFASQGKSPNDFGFSQGKELLDRGFPFVSVAHLIISDASPEEAWQKVSVAEILDKDGRLGEFRDETADLLPGMLISRTYGRLTKNCAFKEIGLISAYLASPKLLAPGPRNLPNKARSGTVVWDPRCRRADQNLRASIKTMAQVADFFENHSSAFLDNPRFDPPLSNQT